MLKLSIIIPTYNRKKQLVRLIDTILISDFKKDDYEIIVIDDHSTDSTCKCIKEKFSHISDLTIITKKQNKRKSHSINIGFQKAKGEYLFFIDDDTIIDQQTIKNLYDFFRKNGNDYMLSPTMYYYDQPDKIWFAGLKMNFWTTGGKFFGKNNNQPQKLATQIKTDGIITAFMVNRQIFEKIGGFNESIFPFQFEELDYCIRAKFGGYTLLVIPKAKLWHDHQTGNFINNPWRLHLEVRNRIITAKLWSNNQFQIFISRLFSLARPIFYLVLKSTLYPANYLQSIKSICNGIYQGIIISQDLTPYYKRPLTKLKKEIY